MAYHGPKLAELQKRKNPAALQARVQQLAANPGTRGLVDTSLLQRFGLTGLAKKRLLNERLAQPVVPGSPMTNRDLARESNAAMDVQYGDQRRLLERQQAQAPDYYDAYIRELNKAQAGATAQGQQTGDAIQKLYGSGPMAPGSNQATLGQVQAGTAQLLGQTQANYQQALANAVQSGKLKALADIGQKRADLSEKEGASNVAYRSKRKSEEFQNVATLALTQGKQDTADASFSAQTGYTPAQWAQMTPAERLTALKKATVAKTKPAAPKAPPADAPYKYGYTKKEWLALPLSKRQEITAANTTKPKGPKGPKPAAGVGSLPPAKEASYAAQVEKIYNWLVNPPKWPSGKKKGQQMTPAEVVNSLSNLGVLSPKGPVDPRILDIARSRFHNKGKLGPFGVKRAHEIGLHVGGRYKTVSGPRSNAGAGTYNKGNRPG